MYASSSNGLVNHYYAVNQAEGHSYNCSYGAGGDCYCAMDFNRVLSKTRAEYRALRASVAGTVTSHKFNTLSKWAFDDLMAEVDEESASFMDDRDFAHIWVDAARKVAARHSA